MIGKMRTAHPTHTGQLLIAAGVITYHNLNEALALAKRACLPLGRVLMMSGSITERELCAALHAQSMVRDGRLPQDYAINILKIAFRSKLSYEEALERHGWKMQAPTAASEVGELLVLIDLISHEELGCAIERMQASALPLGRVLVADGLVKSYELVGALNAAVLIRRHEITKEEAVELLRSACLRRISFDQAMSLAHRNGHVPNHYLKLGELLGRAGLVCESDTIDAIELGLTSNELVGDILVQKGLISKEILHCALDLQELIAQGVINAQQASDVLRSVHRGKGTLTDCMRELERFSDAVLHLLKVADYVTDDDIKIAASKSEGQIVDLPEVLYDTGFIDRQVLDLARRCQGLIDDGVMPPAQAEPVLRAFRKPEEPAQGKKTTDTWDIDLEVFSAA